MTNREWLNNLSNEELAGTMFDVCLCCNYHDAVGCKGGNRICKDGILEWLSKKHIEPMPEIKIGDVVFVRIGGHFEKLVVMSDVYASNLHNMMVRWRELDNIEKIERMNDEKEMMECIWRADNGIE